MPPVVTIPASPLGNVFNSTTSNSMQGPPDAGLGAGFQFGPWWVPGAKGGAAWYGITIPLQINTALQIHKSIDDRATFQLVAQTGINDITQLWGTFMPSTGTVLTMAVTRVDFLVRLLTFDFSTETFGAASVSSGVNTSSSGVNQVQVLIQPSGLIFIFYDTAILGTSRTNYRTFSLGVWSANTVLYTGLGGLAPANLPVASIAMETSGRFHGWICDQSTTPGSPQFWNYFQVSSAGVVGAVSIAYTANQTIIQQFFNGTHLSQIKGNQLFFPFSFTGVDNNIRMGCLVGTGLSAPTWQFVQVDPNSMALPQADLGTQDYLERDGAAVLDINGNLFVFFDVMDNFNTKTLANGGQVWYALWNGTAFNNPILFFDSSGATRFQNQQLPQGEANMFVLSMMPTQKSDGSWTLMVSTAFSYVNQPAGVNASWSYNEVIFTRTGLTLACPVGGGPLAQVGVPYSAQVIATGTPPYTFVLLSGPAWLTINALTGVLSGIPTVSGPFCYTVRVTDSTGLTATVTCCPAGTSSGPPQPGSPCTSLGIGPAQSTDTQFELQRVYATMKPAPRIPVRGS